MYTVRSTGVTVSDSIRQDLRRELIARGFSATLASPNGTMVLCDDAWSTAADLANLLDQMVSRREKVFWSVSAVGQDTAKKSYDDVVLAIDAIKTVIGRL